MYTMEESKELAGGGYVPKKEKDKKPNFFVRVWNWFKNLFK